MKLLRIITIAMIFVLALSLVSAQETATPTPETPTEVAPTEEAPMEESTESTSDLSSVTASHQASVNGVLVIDQVVSDGAGFIVIHADNGGSPGMVLGYARVVNGTNNNVRVLINTNAATTTLHAMLHTDTGVLGVYEFGTVEGADAPVIVDGAPVMDSFTIDLLIAEDQFYSDNMLVISTVVAQQDGFIAVYSDDNGSMSHLVGVAPVTAGTNNNVMVELTGENITPVLYPVLHVDTGALGTFEYDAVSDLDLPVGGTLRTHPILTNQPIMRAVDQVVVTNVNATSVLSETEGWLVVHAQGEDGGVGDVIGYAPLNAGMNRNVNVTVDSADVTPVIFLMLHSDTGEVGTYEFGTVEGADAPVLLNDAPYYLTLNAVPSINYSGTRNDNIVTIDSALIDQRGWLVIHAEQDGSFGPVLGFAPLLPGVNYNIEVVLNDEGITPTLWPMLHYDTGVIGTYEFGTVEGADGPVVVNGNVVTAPWTPDTSE